MQRASDKRFDLIVIVCGAQMGKTEVMMCIAGHRLDDGPYAPVLWIAPTEKSVKTLADDRFMKMLQATPSLWTKLEKGRRNRVTEKFVSGIRVGFGWAGSATELASNPAGIVLVDERDRMLDDVAGEGDPLTLARARAKNFSTRTVIVSSTPTVEDASPIWSLWREGTREKWSWPCLSCGEYWVPSLEYLIYPKDATPGEARRKAHMVCPHCGTVTRDNRKTEMNREGRYQAHVLEKHGDESTEVPVPDLPEVNASTHWVSGMCSPWQTYGEIAEMIVAAKLSRRPDRVQSAVNTYAGEVFRMHGDAPRWEAVLGTRLAYARGTVPIAVQVITAGVDVQQDGLYYAIRGWGYGAESWLIDEGYLFGRTDFDQVWMALHNLITAPIGDHTIHRVFVDSGYKPGKIYRRPENVIYQWCRRHRGLAFPTKGHDQQDKPIKASDIDVSAGGKVIRHGIKLWHINTDYCKTWLHAQMEWPEGEEGGWHCHADVGEDYAKQIVSEEVLVKPTGRRTWMERGPNHWLDCEVLNYAAALSLNVYQLPAMAQPEPVSTAVQPPSPGRFARHGL